MIIEVLTLMLVIINTIFVVVPSAVKIYAASLEIRKDYGSGITGARGLGSPDSTYYIAFYILKLMKKVKGTMASYTILPNAQ